MRTSHWLIIAASLGTIISCSVSEEQGITEEYPGVRLVFEASNEEESPTKTSVQSDGKSVWWSPEEDINIFYGASESSKFTSTNTEPTAKAQFTGILRAFTGETETGVADYFWATYPYNAENTCDGSSVIALLPSAQTAKAETFSDKQWLTVARSQGLALSFYAVCAGFRFSVTKEGITSVTFKGNNNEILAGKARIGMDADNRPLVLENITEEKEITLSAPKGQTLVPGTLYYITFFPTTFTQGFTITFTTDTETGTRVYDSAISFNRTDVHRGRDWDQNTPYHPLVQPNNEIWYTSSNGEIVVPNSTNNIDANIVSNTYSNGLGIIRFDASPTVLGNGVFADCTELVTIQIPDSVTSIGDSAFWECLKLVSVTLPNSLLSLGVSCFYGCTSLHEIDVPDSVQEIGSGCFSDCASLYRVGMPANLSIISSDCFWNCSNLSVISIPSNVTKIENAAFRGCAALPAVLTIPESVWRIGDLAFCDCIGINKVYLMRQTAVTIEERAFNGCTCSMYVPSSSLAGYMTKSRTGTLYPFRFQSLEAEFIEPVDLGLSIKWAPVNLGASSVTERGSLFRWGEISPQDNYSSSNYKWYDYDSQVYTQYTNVSRRALNGTPDNIVNLYSWDDAAKMNWGCNWRMPSWEEIQELINNCEWTPVWKPNYGGLLQYMLVTGPNGNSITLPADGSGTAYYLSCELEPKQTSYDNSSSRALSFYPREDENCIDYLGAYKCSRFLGASVRPVYDNWAI